MKSRRPLRGHKWADLRADPDLPRNEREADACFARVFATEDGRAALDYLHAMTTWKRNTPLAPDGALRELEAQRFLVATIEARIARHHEWLSATARKDG